MPQSGAKVMFTWISAGNFSAEAAFLIDPLSLIMLLVVSGVSTLIHIFSIGYMHDDPGFPPTSLISTSSSSTCSSW